MNLTNYIISSYINNLQLLNMQKQSQTYQNQSQFLVCFSWLISKQTQILPCTLRGVRANPILPAFAGKIAPLFRMPFYSKGGIKY
jgi:hypothetical protein